jgi:DNA-binding NtrC family response regulator
MKTPEERGPMFSVSKQEERNSSRNDRRGVLCVDDAQPGLELRTNIMETEGYEVTALTDPSEAADAFQPGKHELAVLDYQMPEMNGAELAEHLRRKSPGLKIILFTGAIYVPPYELKYFDRVVHKLEGVVALLEAMKSVIEPVTR